MVEPLWTAAVDPCVLTAYALPDDDTDGHTDAQPRIDWRPYIAKVTVHPGVEHVRIEHRDVVVRIDVIGGTMARGPVGLRFLVPFGRDLDARLAALHQLAWQQDPRRLPIPHTRLANMLLALLAFDARGAGASLRTIADQLLEPGEWPGDGEHRKSRIRRLAAAGEAMVKAGPRAILAKY